MHFRSCFFLFSDLKVEWVISSSCLVDRPRSRLAMTNWLACLKLSQLFVLTCIKSMFNTFFTANSTYLTNIATVSLFYWTKHRLRKLLWRKSGRHLFLKNSWLCCFIIRWTKSGFKEVYETERKSFQFPSHALYT